MCGVFFVKQKTAYVIRISDWSSDVCASDLVEPDPANTGGGRVGIPHRKSVLAPIKNGATAHGRHRREVRNPNPHRCHHRPDPRQPQDPRQIGRAPWRERVCQYVSISVVAGSLKKNNTNQSKKHKTTK